MQWPSVCRKLTNLKMNTTDNEHYLKNKDDGMIHANFWLLFISCYLLLGTCHLVLATCSVLPVICYRLLATCYSLLIAASNLNFPYDSGLFEAKYCKILLPFAPVMRLALVATWLKFDGFLLDGYPKC